MKASIIVNKDIYTTYKDEILPLNARLFTTPYFYNLKGYEVPLDLLGIEKYLSFTKEIDIYSCATFIDFVNIVLILSFLKNNNYDGSVNIKYVFKKDKKLTNCIFVNTQLTNKDYDNIGLIVKTLINDKPLPNIDFKLVGYLNFKNFYNMLIDGEKFMFALEEIIEEKEEDVEEIAAYLEDKYSNMGLNKEFYLKYLSKYMEK